MAGIVSLYTKVSIALQVGSAGIKKAISLAISSFLNYLDGGLVGDVIAWAIEWVIKQAVDLEAKALSITLRCEYLQRAGKLSMESAKRAWNLTNKCSKCKCIGHNKQNHPSEMETFLASNKLLGYVKDAEELIGVTEEDG